MRTKNKTKVIFRKFKKDGDIIAIFPEIPCSCTGYDMLSYMHIGQHGACDYPLSETTPATPSEYNDLKTELERIVGYDLHVIRRTTYKHFLSRQEYLKQ